MPDSDVEHNPKLAKTARPGGLKKGSWLRSNLEALGMAVLLAVVLRIFVVQAFTIPSGSMIPTLLVGDYILVNKFIYHFRTVERGDIVVFRSPENPNRDYIKRVVGLPGEEVSIKGGTIVVEGRTLDEPYILYQQANRWGGWNSARDNWGPEVIPESHYFVLGDNRANSRDSRVWGFLHSGKVRGRAFIIYFSWDSEARTIRWNRLGKALH
jgi:signal peptidase I